MKYIMISLILSFGCLLNAQILWQQNYGGSSIDELVEIIGGQENELLLIGSTLSGDVDITNYLGQKDALLINTDLEGNVNWSLNLGGTANDELRTGVQTPDGTWFVAGKTISSDIDITDGNNSEQGLLCKLSKEGELQWCKSYGEIEDDEFFTLSISPTGNLIMSGAVDNEDLFNFSESRHSNQDFWLLEISPDGTVIWEKKYGGSDGEQALHHIQDEQGNIYITGFAISNDLDLETNYGLKDIWLIKTDPQGNIIWKKSYGGISFEEGRKLILHEDLIYVTGGTFSNDNTFNEQLIGQEDGYILCLSTDTGELVKQINIGGEKSDRINDMVLLNEEIIVAGFTKSDIDGIQGYGGTDYWISGFDLDLNKRWTRLFGGSNEEVAHSIFNLGNDLYIGGSSYSSDQDVSGNYGLADIWVLNHDLLSSSSQKEKKSISYKIYPDEILIQSLPNGFYKYSIYDLLGRRLRDGDFQVYDNDILLELSESSFFLINIVNTNNPELTYSIKGVSIR